MRIQSIIFMLVSLVDGVVQAQSLAAPSAGDFSATARGPSLGLALEAAQTALAVCHAQGLEVAVLVTDSVGAFKVSLVSDAKSGLITTLLQRKAAVALAFKQNSAEVAALAKTDQAVADKLAVNSNFLAAPGALLMKVDDDIIGVIVVSGAHSEGNIACAQAGLDKVKARLK